MNTIVEEFIQFVSLHMDYHLANIATLVIFIIIVSLWRYKKSKKFIFYDAIKSFIFFIFLYLLYIMFKFYL